MKYADWAKKFVKLEERTGLKIACIEEIAYNIGLINYQKLHNIADDMGKSIYAHYL